MANKSIFSRLIKIHAQEKLGIDLVGICQAKKLPEAEKYLKEFLKSGYHGEMHYLENPALRTDPKQLLPSAESVIVIGINYYHPQSPTLPSQGKIARYAWGRDYHKVLKKVLLQLASFLEQHWPGHQHRLCVDSAPLLEKAFAKEAGLGFYGKNTTLISPQLGSYFLLGEIITSLPLKSDTPVSGSCGTCRRCLDGCPTQALLAPGKMDARRCVSYLTLESKQIIPDNLIPSLQNRLAGCDICQEVCPYNLSLAKPLQHSGLKEKAIAGDSIELEKVLTIQNDQEYLSLFAGSPLMRTKRFGLIRNALALAQNAIRKDRQKYLPLYQPLIETIATTDPHPLLRTIAKNTLQKIQEFP